MKIPQYKCIITMLALTNMVGNAVSALYAVPMQIDDTSVDTFEQMFRRHPDLYAQMRFSHDACENLPQKLISGVEIQALLAAFAGVFSSTMDCLMFIPRTRELFSGIKFWSIDILSKVLYTALTAYLLIQEQRAFTEEAAYQIAKDSVSETVCYPDDSRFGLGIEATLSGAWYALMIPMMINIVKSMILIVHHKLQQPQREEAAPLLSTTTEPATRNSYYGLGGCASAVRGLFRKMTGRSNPTQTTSINHELDNPIPAIGNEQLGGQKPDDALRAHGSAL